MERKAAKAQGRVEGWDSQRSTLFFVLVSRAYTQRLIRQEFLNLLLNLRFLTVTKA